MIIFLTDKNAIEKLEDGLEALLWRGYRSRRLGPLITAVDNAAAAAIGACKRLHSALARPATSELELGLSMSVGIICLFRYGCSLCGQSVNARSKRRIHEVLDQINQDN